MSVTDSEGTVLPEAGTWNVQGCADENCPCCGVYLITRNDAGMPIGIMRLSPDNARLLSGELAALADRMEAQAVRLNGRLT